MEGANVPQLHPEPDTEWLRRMCLQVAEETALRLGQAVTFAGLDRSAPGGESGCLVARFAIRETTEEARFDPEELQVCRTRADLRVLMRHSLRSALTHLAEREPAVRH